MRERGLAEVPERNDPACYGTSLIFYFKLFLAELTEIIDDIRGIVRDLERPTIRFNPRIFKPFEFFEPFLH